MWWIFAVCARTDPGELFDVFIVGSVQHRMTQPNQSVTSRRLHVHDTDVISYNYLSEVHE